MGGVIRMRCINVCGFAGTFQPEGVKEVAYTFERLDFLPEEGVVYDLTPDQHHELFEHHSPTRHFLGTVQTGMPA